MGEGFYIIILASYDISDIFVAIPIRDHGPPGHLLWHLTQFVDPRKRHLFYMKCDHSRFGR